MEDAGAAAARLTLPLYEAKEPPFMTVLHGSSSFTILVRRGPRGVTTSE